MRVTASATRVARYLQNSIVALNLPGQDCQGLIYSLGHNLIGNRGGCIFKRKPSDLAGDPGLGAFVNRPGPGRGYFPLLPASRAIRAGSVQACPVADQLGKPRGVVCDLGAIEFRPGDVAEIHCPSGDVQCLIEAIEVANVNELPTTLILEAGIYSLTAINNTMIGPNGLPSVSGTLTIRGAGRGATIVERANDGEFFFRLVHIQATGVLTFEELTLRGGKFNPRGTDFTDVSGAGAGIFNDGGALTLTKTVLRNNKALASGGGLYSRGGTVTIANSRLIRNTAGRDGGGMSIQSSTVDVTDSSVTDNTVTRGGGGGVHQSGGSLTFVSSTVAGNYGQGAGGLLINPSTPLIFIDGAVVGNESATDGGGFSAGTLTLVGTTVANNRAAGSGGGIYHGAGTATITNGTLSGNTSDSDGGGIFNNGEPIVLQNTILAGNVGVGMDCSGPAPVESLGTNLIGDPSGCAIDLQSDDLIGDPGLDTFVDDGAPGHGHFPLLAISPAIDAANEAVCPVTDQIGQPRVGRCDIGAVEFQP